MRTCLQSLFAISLLLSACTGKNSQNQNGPSDKAQGIYDGEVANSDSLIVHSTVMLLATKSSGEGYACTASVLSPTILLTAAHCVTEQNDKGETVMIATPLQVFNMGNAEAFQSAKAVANPDYIAIKNGEPMLSTISNGYDAALVQLSSPLPDYYKPVQISDSLEALSKEQISIAGYGAFNIDPTKGLDYKLRNGPVTIDPSVKELKSPFISVDDQTKVSTNQNLTLMAANTTYAPIIAFKKTDTTASICHGDSGGPLYFEKDGIIHIVGINVSFFQSDLSKNVDCVTNEIESSVSMVGPTLHFILDTFKDLNGSPLASPIRGSVETDPNTFPGQMQNPTTTEKNTYLDLTTEAVVISDDEIALMSQEQIRVACTQAGASATTDIYFAAPVAQKDLDGITKLLLATVHGNDIGYFEARIRKNTDGTAFVLALTPDGFVAKKTPVMTSCPEVAPTAPAVPASN